jgi:hypothetical protein
MEALFNVWFVEQVWPHLSAWWVEFWVNYILTIPAVVDDSGYGYTNGPGLWMPIFPLHSVWPNRLPGQWWWVDGGVNIDRFTGFYASDILVRRYEVSTRYMGRENFMDYGSIAARCCPLTRDFIFYSKATPWGFLQWGWWIEYKYSMLKAMRWYFFHYPLSFGGAIRGFFVNLIGIPFVILYSFTHVGGSSLEFAIGLVLCFLITYGIFTFLYFFWYLLKNLPIQILDIIEFISFWIAAWVKIGTWWYWSSGLIYNYKKKKKYEKKYKQRDIDYAEYKKYAMLRFVMLVYSFLYFILLFSKKFVLYYLVNGFFSTLAMPLIFMSYYFFFRLKSCFFDTIYFFFWRFFLFFKNFYYIFL